MCEIMSRCMCVACECVNKCDGAELLCVMLVLCCCVCECVCVE